MFVRRRVGRWVKIGDQAVPPLIQALGDRDRMFVLRRVRRWVR
jgi:hypothetical protein